MAKLSKSKIKQGIQCNKALWLQIHRKELASISEDSQKRFDIGNEIGTLAQTMYPDGIMVDSKNNKIKLEQTKEALTHGKTIFEAAFESQDTLCQVDILKPNNGKWDLSEVKAGTSAKPEYIEDIAIQYYIIKNTDLSLDKCYVMHINKNATGASDLFIERDITTEIQPYQEKYANLIQELIKVADSKEEPVCSIGPHCNAPYECSFKKYCWSHIPTDKKTIFDIPGFRNKWLAYEQGIIEVNEQTKEDLIKLGVKSHIVESIIENKIWFNKEEIKKFIDDLVYPLISFDFESMQYIVPPFANVKPYEQVPFQYSINILNEDQTIKSVDFLHQNPDDPRPELIKTLKEHMPKTGHIMAYNMKFEKYVLKKLMEVSPEEREFLQNIIDRMVDPYLLIEKSLYHPDFKDSFSLKSVAPVLNGEYGSYKDGGIPNGEEAQNVYKKLVNELDIMKRLEYNESLRKYCNKDTMNLILIIQNLKKIIANE